PESTGSPLPDRSSDPPLPRPPPGVEEPPPGERGCWPAPGVPRATPRRVVASRYPTHTPGREWRSAGRDLRPRAPPGTPPEYDSHRRPWPRPPTGAHPGLGRDHSMDPDRDGP